MGAARTLSGGLERGASDLHGAALRREPPRTAAVLELARLDVRPGRTAAFEAAFEEARTLLAASPGHRRHELRRCVEHESRYLLLVWWDTLESHTEGFRHSADYARWKELLHGFYDPFPEVEHYGPLPGPRAE